MVALEYVGDAMDGADLRILGRCVYDGALPLEQAAPWLFPTPHLQATHIPN